MTDKELLQQIEMNGFGISPKTILSIKEQGKKLVGVQKIFFDGSCKKKGHTWRKVCRCKKVNCKESHIHNGDPFGTGIISLSVCYVEGAKQMCEYCGVVK